MKAGITNINDILALKTALERCSKESLQLIVPIRSHIEEKQLKIQKVLFDLQHRLEDAERKLNNQNNMLTLCKSRIEYDESGNIRTPNCTSEERAVRRATNELKAARRNLDEMKQLTQIVENRLREYENKVSIFRSLNTDFTDSCSEYLHKIISLVNEYLNLQDEYKKI